VANQDYISFRYAYEALANNEFRGSEYHCSSGDLVPPTTDADFNLPYPQGFAGNQACPITDGTTYISHTYDLFVRLSLSLSVFYFTYL